jgi:Fe-Mn family superoxide dismutase
MKPKGGGQPQGMLAEMIDRDFGSFDKFSKEFSSTAGSVAGSGWGLLAMEPVGKRLVVCWLEKHENVAVIGAIPILVVDVWEHAYYLKYQNKRADYLDAWMKNLVDYDAAGKRLDAAMACAGH